MLIRLRNAAREDGSSHQPTIPQMEYTPGPDFQNLISPRAGDIRQTQISTDYKSMKSEAAAPPDFESLSMANRRDVLKLTDAREPAIIGCLHLEAHRNTVRAFAGPLLPAASGMPRYKNFCDFVGRNPSPAASETVRLLGGLFRPGKTFGIYLPYVMMTSSLLRRPTGWLTAEIRAVPHGLRNAQSISFRSPTSRSPRTC